MNPQFDVVIIGSGPAGASAAFELAESNLKVAIIEKEKLPRYKTCGGGLVYRGRRHLPFEISEAVEREFFDVDIRFDAKKLAFKTKRDRPIISMIMRDDFDHLITKKAEKLGVTIFEEEQLLALELGEIAKLKTSRREITTKFVIAADGALSPTSKMAGWQETRMMCPALEYEIKVPEADFESLSTSARFDIDVVPYGYGWCFPKAKHLSIGVGNFMKAKKGIDLKSHYQTYLKTLGISEILESEAHGFIIPISPRKDGFVKQNVFLCGDAAGFADPVTAEGISNAIYSGILAAKSITESDLDLEKAKQIYQSKLEEKLIPELNIGVRLAELFYQNKTTRNLLLKKFGQRAAEYMTDIFMGDRSYPADFKQKIKQKLKLKL
ncbi:geranylgeranyl reductase family protein [Psychroflexus aestuariivivens]|uniref:geranylgeranyl reductase family protein n=1 Tax=Psychroflexus aestuariivivens TaxID=1795040 RepID=UPI000FDCB47C|nr:geranylgeranyl reductase family protein [Psychroflexus aestuariivivens]